jgi:hypothetical protein
MPSDRDQRQEKVILLGGIDTPVLPDLVQPERLDCWRGYESETGEHLFPLEAEYYLHPSRKSVQADCLKYAPSLL